MLCIWAGDVPCDCPLLCLIWAFWSTWRHIWWLNLIEHKGPNGRISLVFPFSSTVSLVLCPERLTWSSSLLVSASGRPDVESGKRRANQGSFSSSPLPIGWLWVLASVPFFSPLDGYMKFKWNLIFNSIKIENNSRWNPKVGHKKPL